MRGACAMAAADLLAKYVANDVAALKRLVAQGAKLQTWSPAIMAAMQGATKEMLEDYAAKGPAFATVLPHWRAFRTD